MALKKLTQEDEEEERNREGAMKDGNAAMDVDVDEAPVVKQNISILSDPRIVALFGDRGFDSAVNLRCSSSPLLWHRRVECLGWAESGARGMLVPFITHIHLERLMNGKSATSPMHHAPEADMHLMPPKACQRASCPFTSKYGGRQLLLAIFDSEQRTHLGLFPAGIRTYDASKTAAEISTY